MRRSISFIIIILIYILSIIVGFLSYQLIAINNYTIKIISCDIIATVFVWIWSVILRNSSVYDPYWSVAPMVIIPLFIKKLNIASISLFILIFLWGIRLTLNWGFTFKGLKYQDWRYDYYKNKFPRLWQLINLGGIHLMPTIIVILIMCPAFAYLENPNFNVITIFGYLLSLFGIACEFYADKQMHKFRKTSSNKTINIGLWKYSRHPNYLGEILMWWGVFIISLSGNIKFYYIVGPIANTLMFYFISIPLMEKRLLKQKDNYLLYQNTTSKLFLLPKKKSKLQKEAFIESK